MHLPQPYTPPTHVLKKEAQAARIAREIEGSAPTNAHVAEERRKDAEKNDGGMDEEEKYSGVQRDGHPDFQKY